MAKAFCPLLSGLATSLAAVVNLDQRRLLLLSLAHLFGPGSGPDISEARGLRETIAIY